MNSYLSKALNIIEESSEISEMKYMNEKWDVNIPRIPGWYTIKSNIPINALMKIGAPDEKHKAHIDIPATIRINNQGILPKFVIQQKGTDLFVVYNGMAKNLKARAREHYNGHRKTFCLGLKKYDSIWDYSWYFDYCTTTKLGFEGIENKMLLKIVEQAWRAEYGWPILCKQ